MTPREARLLTPETAFERVVAMALERGKLSQLLLEEPESLTAQALGRIVAALEAAGPVQAALAIRPVHSLFLQQLLPLARRALGVGPEVTGQA
jgi:hypothetical protein